MPADTVRKTTPVLIHLDPVHWREFKKIAGSRKASMRLRAMMREVIVEHRKATRPTGK